MPPGPATGQQRQSRGLNRSLQPLNVSTLSSNGPGPPKLANGGPPRMQSMYNTTPLTSVSSSNQNNNYCNSNNNNTLNDKDRIGVREALTSLGLLCLGKIFFLNESFF